MKKKKLNKTTPSLNKKIKKGDKVLVIAGDSRNQKGEVLSRKGDYIVVQGLNFDSRHKKGNEPGRGSVLKLESPIHISNLKVLNTEGRPVDLKVHVNEAGNRELFYKAGNNEIAFRELSKTKKA